LFCLTYIHSYVYLYIIINSKTMTTTFTTPTAEQVKRINQAIKETQKVIDNEMRYPADLRKHDVVEWHMNHLQKLNQMLNAK
jgi:hypothetical protein